MPPKKKSQASGQAANPSKNQKRKPAKKPWTRAEEIGARVVGAINPFD